MDTTHVQNTLNWVLKAANPITDFKIKLVELYGSPTIMVHTPSMSYHSHLSIDGDGVSALNRPIGSIIEAVENLADLVDEVRIQVSMLEDSIIFDACKSPDPQRSESVSG